jgi:predicted Zn finger-like uncharacterized protein
MNFVCDKCKQKYHVADEKIRGRAVTRFRCKKCENVIELRGDALPDPDAPDAPKQADAPDSRPRPATMAPSSGRPAVTPIGASAPTGPAAPPARTAARARAPTSVGVAFNAGMAASAAKAAPRTASTSAILNASETGWYAGIRDLPVGPLTRKELIAKVQSAEVTPDTLVWREGLDDWRPLRNVAELGDVLRLGAQRISGNLLDEMGRRPPPAPAAAPERRSAQVVPLRQPAPASAPALTRPAMTDDDEEATRVTGMDPAIAALIPRTLGVPVKPAPKAPVEEEPSDLTLTEPPHASPAHLARGVEPSFAKPAPKISPPKAPPPKAPLRAAPSALAQKPAPAPPEPAPEPVVELTAPSQPPLTIESAPSLRVSSMPPAAAAVAALAGDDELPEDLFGRKPFPPQSNAPSLESFGLSSAFSGGALPPASTPAPAAPSSSVQPGPILLGPGSGHSPTMPGYAPATSVPAPAQKPVGLSMPVMVLMAGVLVVGVFGGVLLAGRLNRPVPQPIPAPVPIAQPQVQPSAPGPTVAINEPAPAVLDPTAPTTAEPPDMEPATPGHPRTPRRTGREPAAPGISAAQAAANARLLQQLGAAAAGPSGGPVNTGRLPTTQTSGATDNTPAPTGAARAGRAIRAFQDSRVVNTCWQNLLRMNPSLRDASVRITLSVGGTGRITSAAISGSPDPRFDSCLRSRLATIPTIGAGESFDAQTTVNLTTGG